MDIHRIALILVLAVGAAALIYNAVSIVNGEGGLAALSSSVHGQQLVQRIF